MTNIGQFPRVQGVINYAIQRESLSPLSGGQVRVILQPNALQDHKIMIQRRICKVQQSGGRAYIYRMVWSYRLLPIMALSLIRSST